MRWLIGHPGPHFSVHDLYEGWTEALRELGEEVYTFNLGDRLTFYDAAFIEASEQDGDGRKYFRKAMTREAAIETAADGIFRTLYKCWPHVVLMVSAFFTPPWMLDMIRGRGHKLVLLHTESPYQDDEQLIRAKSADINLLNDPVNLAAYQALGTPAAYMPHAYRPSVHYPPPAGAAKPYDLTFVGTGFPSRVKFFEQMTLDDLTVKLAGPWLDLPEDSPLRDWTATNPDGCLDNDEAAALYRQSKCGINFYRREGETTHEGEGWAMGPREVEMAACGLFFARDSRPESDETFPMLPAYSGPEDAADLIKWYAAHDSERDKRAAAAREAVTERTFDNNAKALMRMLIKESTRGKTPWPQRSDLYRYNQRRRGISDAVPGCVVDQHERRQAGCHRVRRRQQGLRRRPPRRVRGLLRIHGRRHQPDLHLGDRRARPELLPVPRHDKRA